MEKCVILFSKIFNTNHNDIVENIVIVSCFFELNYISMTYTVQEFCYFNRNEIIEELLMNMADLNSEISENDVATLYSRVARILHFVAGDIDILIADRLSSASGSHEIVLLGKDDYNIHQIFTIELRTEPRPGTTEQDGIPFGLLYRSRTEYSQRLHSFVSRNRAECFGITMYMRDSFDDQSLIANRNPFDDIAKFVAKRVTQSDSEFAQKFEDEVVNATQTATYPSDQSEIYFGNPFTDSLFDDTYTTQLLLAKPETKKDLNDVEKQYKKKLEDLLWDLDFYGIDIDTNTILEKIKTAKNNQSKYELRLELVESSIKHRTVLDKCEIYVSNDENGTPVPFTPILKAVYLAMLTMDEGIVVADLRLNFTELVSKIYERIPDKLQKDDEGIMSKDFYVDDKLFRFYTSSIRKALAKKIANRHILSEFAIEGYRNKPVFIQRATPELKAQIEQVFNL